MSQEEIAKIKTDIAVMGHKIEALPSLIAKMEKNTEAVTDLTHQIKMQVKMYGDIKIQVDDHSSRIRSLEDDQHRDNIILGMNAKLFWIVITSIVGGVGGGLWYFISGLMKHVASLH